MSIMIGIETIDATKYIGRQIVKILSDEYKFDYNSAIEFLDFNTVKSDKIDKPVLKEKGNIPLPFCGVINKNCCYGIRLNYGLYTQCNNHITVYNNEFPLCQTCYKQVEKNSNGEPTYGYITNRIEQGMNYRDPKGKVPISYANIMEKMNITRDAAEKAAKKVGLVIPESEFIIKKAIRGRPKKDTTADDTASESSFTETEKKTEKKRGRPKKNKDTIDVNDIGNHMLKELVNQVKNSQENKIANIEPNTENKEDDEESHEAEAVPIKLDKKNTLGYKIVDTEQEADYLLTSDNQLYTPFTHDLKGNWDIKTKSIEPVDSDDELFN